MEIIKDDYSDLRCMKHKLQITYIYMKQDSVQKLACFKCCIENGLDNNYLIEIESLLSFNNDEFVLKNFPPGLSKSLQEQLNSQNIQSNKRDELKQQIIQQFDYFQKNIIEAIDKHKKELLNHIDTIEEERINCIDTYNRISQKQEIINNILNLSNNPIQLNTNLTNLINAKYLSMNKDQEQIENVVKKYSYVKNQIDIQYIHNQLLTILENIKSTNMLKLNLNRNDQQPQQIQQLNNNINQLSLNEQNTQIITQNQNNKQNQLVNQNSIQKQIQSVSSLPLIEEEILIESLLQLQTITNLPQYQNIKIDLSLQNIGQEGAKSVREALKQCLNLTSITLDLNYNNLGDIGLVYILEVLSSLKQINLVNLYLAGNNLSGQSVNLITQTLKQLDRINSLMLGLSNNQNIADDHMIDLINVINSKKKLYFLFLNLDETNTGDRTVVVLSEVIKSLPNLKTLYLSFRQNLISDNSIIQLCQSIQCIASQIDSLNLYLERNNIGDNAVQYLINTYTLCSKLEDMRLHLDNNNIGTQGKQQLEQFKKACNTTFRLFKEDKFKITY